MFPSVLHLGALLGIHFPSTGFFHWWQGLYWPEQNRGYAFTSSIGSDFGQITLFGSAIAIYRHINCDAPRCWRRGPHKTADGHHKLCRKHHPDLPDHKLSLDEIHLRHRSVQDPIALSLGRLEKDVADLHERHDDLVNKIDDFPK